MLLLNIQNTCIQLIASIRTGVDPPVCTCKDTNKTGTSKEKNAKNCKMLTNSKIKTYKNTYITEIQIFTQFRHGSLHPIPPKNPGERPPDAHRIPPYPPLLKKKLFPVTYCKPTIPDKKPKKIEKIFCRNEKRLYFCTRFPPEETTTGNKRNLK